MEQDGMNAQRAVEAAMAVLDAFMVAFNGGDQSAFDDTLNYPHVRFASGKVVVLEQPGIHRLENFRAHAAADNWARSRWDERTVIHASADKVHLDTRFSRYRADGSLIATYRSLYIVTCIDGHWGIQARSSYAQ